MDDITATRVRPCLLAYCHRHDAFYPSAQACPQCTRHPEPRTPVGTLLLGVCGGLVVVYLLTQSLLGPGHGPFGWW